MTQLKPQQARPHQRVRKAVRRRKLQIVPALPKSDQSLGADAAPKLHGHMRAPERELRPLALAGGPGRRVVSRRVLEATANLTAVHTVGQIRLIAVDLLRATGLELTPRAGGPANGGAGPALTPHRIRRDWTQSGGR
jgi:hypothetical protein